ncbi:MAG: CGNR zinc finger domain-containing protein [Acidimicrobiales bacterium]|nr:CGNR zinc finger domain-containing protein [Acidimicrobiales bacterium]MCB9395612.1 CGNR zinc finger domain-containing protein [Acidimicrobiaceae bacterium]
MTLPSVGAAAVVQRVVELVDAVERTTDRIDQRSAVIGVFERWNDGPDAALDARFDRVIAAIARLSQIFDDIDADRSAALINGWFNDVAATPRLVREPVWGWHIHVDPPDADWSTWLLASSALGFAALLAERDHVPWGRCDDDGCRRPYLDRGRRTAQRYCSPTCASRARVRRHRARTDNESRHAQAR